MREFAGSGFVVMPQAVPAAQVATAHQAIDALLAARPPKPGHVGNLAFFERAEDQPELMSLMYSGSILAAAEQLTGAGTLQVRPQPQVALNYPPFPHRPGGHHLDGAQAEPDGRPGTFTMLVGVLLTDQPRDDMGNLWVWPGSHLSHQDYFRRHGPDALLAGGASPPIALGEPEQVHGEAGDVLLAHYLLGHNIGGNTSDFVRRVVYFRLKHREHDQRWRTFLQDAWADYPPIRALDGCTMRPAVPSQP